jgi:hypothetical protein
MTDVNKSQQVMTYVMARPKIKTGDLIAVRGKSGVFAQLVRLITNSAYTHTGIAIWLKDQNGEKGLYVAEEDGVKNVYTPLSQYAEDEFDVFRMPVMAKNARIQSLFQDTVHEIQAAMRDRIQYSWLQILRIGVYKLVRITLPGSRRGMVCSGFSAAIYRELGWNPVDLANPPAPSDLTAALGTPSICVRAL